MVPYRAKGFWLMWGVPGKQGPAWDKTLSSFSGIVKLLTILLSP